MCVFIISLHILLHCRSPAVSLLISTESSPIMTEISVNQCVCVVCDGSCFSLRQLYLVGISLQMQKKKQFDLFPAGFGSESLIYFSCRRCHMTDSWSTFTAWMDMKLSRWNNQSKRRRTQLENKRFIEMSGGGR